MDLYVNTVLIISYYDWIYWMLWPGIFILNLFMIGEDILSQYFYNTDNTNKLENYKKN